MFRIALGVALGLVLYDLIQYVLEERR